MANIVLIGMPGCGKSTVGVLLAKALGKAFIDTDVVLQAKEGRKPNEHSGNQRRTGFSLAVRLWEILQKGRGNVSQNLPSVSV